VIVEHRCEEQKCRDRIDLVCEIEAAVEKVRKREWLGPEGERSKEAKARRVRREDWK
jgi:hypothetical protein